MTMFDLDYSTMLYINRDVWVLCAMILEADMDVDEYKHGMSERADL